MKNNSIPEPAFLSKTAKESEAEYRRELLDGPFMKNIIKNIEGAALNGYSGYQHLLHKGDKLKDYQIAQAALREAGYKCEIETRTKQSSLFRSFTYTETKFIIRW